jgi:hypothetical protein
MLGNSLPATAPDPLLDHLVGGGQQRFRHVDAKQPSGLKVDDELELQKPCSGSDAPTLEELGIARGIAARSRKLDDLSPLAGARIITPQPCIR